MIRKSADGRKYILSGTQSVVFSEKDKVGRKSINGTTEEELAQVLVDRLGIKVIDLIGNVLGEAIELAEKDTPLVVESQEKGTDEVETEEEASDYRMPISEISDSHQEEV
jgi:hypothetical protein